MSAENLKKFEQLVLKNPSLQTKLKDAQNEGNFVKKVVQLGQENGISFTAQEVSARMAAATAARPTGGDLSDRELDAMAAGYTSYGDSILCGYCGKTSATSKETA
jgi:predicted ribosomally synthesized peptide with nif11-like leader